MTLVFTYDEVQPDQIVILGGKGQNISLVYQAGFPVPSGYILSADAFRATLAEAAVDKEIAEFLSADIAPEALSEVCDQIRSALVAVAVGDEIKDALCDIYHRLAPSAPAGLIVRSSATVEDSPRAS